MEEKAARLAAKAAATREKLAAESVPTEAAGAGEEDKKALIAAALARAAEQKAAVTPANIEALNPAQQAQVDEAEARRLAAATQEKS